MSIETDTALAGLSREVAIDILVHGAQTRSSVGRRMGISPATVTRLVRPLLDSDVLVETEAYRTAERGRNAFALDVVPGRYRFIGVKLTADSVYAVVTDLRASILDRVTVELSSLEVAEVVTTVRSVVDELSARGARTVDAVGVTVGGLVTDGEVVADSPFMHWRDVPLRSILAAELNVPVYLDNDVVGLTKVQHWFGEGTGHESFALITIGAGIGYGLVINHQQIPTGVAPISHYPVNPGGRLCSYGHRGCMTAMVSSGSIASAVSEVIGHPVGFSEALELARSGDPRAVSVIDESARALGRAAAAVSTMTGVRRIILSGEGVDIASIAAEALQDGVSEFDIREVDHHDLVVRPMAFDEWARGAAVVAIQSSFPA
ncbi:ROK family protein [Microcella sp.]|uniref:ROK family protein n=1 Tax=Microcella sp. TaxID=1913979 RepID=UPI00391B849D